MHLLPDMSLRAQAGVIGPPVAPSPTRTLVQELDIILQRGFELTFLVVLDPSLPLMGHEPAGDKVIVVRIELELGPSLSLKTVKEQGTLQDLGPEGARASGHA